MKQYHFQPYPEDDIEEPVHPIPRLEKREHGMRMVHDYMPLLIISLIVILFIGTVILLQTPILPSVQVGV